MAIRRPARLVAARQRGQPARGPGRAAVTCGVDSRPYLIDVVRVQPQGYVSFRWASAFGGVAPAPGNATLVEFDLRPVGDEIGVTVVESGSPRSTCPTRCARTSGRATRAAGGMSSRVCGRGQSGLGYARRLRAGCSRARRSAPPGTAELLASTPGARPGRWPTGCRSPARRSRSTWPCSRSAPGQPPAGRPPGIVQRQAEGLTATADWLRARATAWLGRETLADQGKDALLWRNVGCFKPALMWDIGHVTQIEPSADALVTEWRSLPEVATRLGLPNSRVKQLLRDRKLLAVNRPTGERAIPAAFIDGDQIVKGLSGTLTVLFDCGFGEEEALRWLFTADDTLPGTPVQALHARHGTEVNRRAQALAF